MLDGYGRDTRKLLLHYTHWFIYRLEIPSKVKREANSLYLHFILQNANIVDMLSRIMQKCLFLASLPSANIRPTWVLIDVRLQEQINACRRSINLLHTGVCYCYCTSFELRVELVFNDGRDKKIGRCIFASYGFIFLKS